MLCAVLFIVIEKVCIFNVLSVSVFVWREDVLE